MGNPEEISNIEHFPLSPRVPRPSQDLPPVPESAPEVVGSARSLTPLPKGVVEFWHHGDRTGEVKPIANTKKTSNHAKRADQLGLALGLLTIIVLTVTIVTLYLANKRYNFENAPKLKASTPVVDFYLGNNVFTKKFKEEKEAKDTILETDSLAAVAPASDDLQVSLKEQMSSMNEKLEQMRARKLIEEAPLPLPNPVAKPPVMPLGVKPTDFNKFDSPLEFNGMLPKPLQQTN